MTKRWYRVLRKVVKWLKEAENLIVLLFCICLVIVGGYTAYDSYCVYKQTIDNSNLIYNPGDNPADFIKNVQGNVVSWLDMDDTTISYPVFQGKDNFEYLNKAFDGSYSLSGSIFMDSRNDPKYETNELYVIYGHHMEANAMFGKLDAYTKEDYFNKHLTGTITVFENTTNLTNQGVDEETTGVYAMYDIHVFAVLEATANNSYIFAPTETPVSDSYSYVKSNHLVWNENNAKIYESGESSKLVVLSTCKYPDTTDRTIVVGVLTPHQK